MLLPDIERVEMVVLGKRSGERVEMVVLGKRSGERVEMVVLGKRSGERVEMVVLGKMSGERVEMVVLGKRWSHEQRCPWAELGLQFTIFSCIVHIILVETLAEYHIFQIQNLKSRHLTCYLYQSL